MAMVWMVSTIIVISDGLLRLSLTISISDIFLFDDFDMDSLDHDHGLDGVHHIAYVRRTLEIVPDNFY